MPASSSSLTGLLVVDKPGLPFGWQEREHTHNHDDLPTSHDVVQRVRRLTGQRRIGHTGTLDPMASGVLVLCLGQATRLVEYYQGHDKRYQAEITLGTATDTFDALGALTATEPIPTLDEAQINAGLAHFRGQISQRPPIYSALKQGGESLHRKARRGESVEIKARRITIHELSLVDFIQPDRLRIDVHVSAGTYIRSLAHDLGQTLGTVAHLSALRRESVGPFLLTQARTLEEIEASHQNLASLMVPSGWGLPFFDLILDNMAIQRLGFGQKLWLDRPNSTVEQNMLLKGFNEQGNFVGIVRCIDLAADGDSALWKAEKWFAGN